MNIIYDAPSDDPIRAAYNLTELWSEHDEIAHTTTIVAGRSGHRARATLPIGALEHVQRIDIRIHEVVSKLAAELDLLAMPVAEQIARGELPSVLRGGDWRSYLGREHPKTYDGWCDAWFGIAWVRLQAFERETEAEWAAEEYEASIAAGGRY